MQNNDEILRQHLCEQIALEEHLCLVIEQQIAEISDPEFVDAKNLLLKTRQALEQHFTPLNELLNKIDRDAIAARTKTVSGNGGGLESSVDQEQKKRRISRILRDDYSSLNLITISNTLLHTTALLLERHEVATLALKHLHNLAPLVIKMGELVPGIIARELRTYSPNIDPAIAETALKNAQLAWSRNHLE